MYADAKNMIPVRFLELDVADSLGIGTAAGRVFIVVDKLVTGHADF